MILLLMVGVVFSELVLSFSSTDSFLFGTTTSSSMSSLLGEV